MEHRFKVVDVNAHLGPDKRSVAVRGREISPERLERGLYQAGVVHAVVSPGAQQAAESYLRPNDAVVRMSVDRPFLAFARVNGPRDLDGRASVRLRDFRSSRADHHADPDDIKQYAYNNRFHGLSLTPAVDGLPDDEALAMLEDAGLPIFVESGQAFEPSAVTQSLLGRFLVTLSGFGGFPLGRGLMDKAIDLLNNHEDLCLDTNFVHYRNVLERVLLEHLDRVLFGSGAPEAHPNVGAVEILALDVSEDALAEAFSKNTARVVAALGPREQ